MGHRITAIVTKLPINKGKADYYDVPVNIHEGYAIIGLYAPHSDYWAEKLGIADNSSKGSSIILDNSTTHFIANEICQGMYALINTDYFGGIGEQHAGVFRDGNAELPVKTGAINECLKFIGVQAREELDEFDTIRLGKYRNFDAFFEKYWDIE